MNCWVVDELMLHWCWVVVEKGRESRDRHLRRWWISGLRRQAARGKKEAGVEAACARSPAEGWLDSDAAGERERGAAGDFPASDTWV